MRIPALVVVAMFALPLFAQESKPADPPADQVIKEEATVAPTSGSKEPLKVKSSDKAPETTAAAAEEDSALVKAAKTQAKNRKKSKSRLSIDDADVKKSTGKLILVSASPDLPPAEQQGPGEEQLSEVARAEELRKARESAQTQVDASRKEVQELEDELARLEETYYNEDDPDFRDEVIQQRFDKAKEHLEAARKRLSDARDLLAKVQ